MFTQGSTAMAVKDLRPSRPSPSCAFAARWMIAAAILVLQSSSSRAQRQEFLPPTNRTCACLNQNLTYTCTVEGPGATVWNGSAFSCPTQENREVILRHGSYSDGTAFGECNDGTIVAQGVSVQDNRYYTSKLIANVSSELNGSTIGCQLSSGGVLTLIGSAQVIVITGPYQLSLVPVVRLAGASASGLRFNWTSVDPTCSTISYESITSGCGSCSIAATNTTTATAVATCTGWQLPSMCTFSVRSVICGFTGVPSNIVAVAIRVPDPPQVNIVPVYSADTNSLIRLFITTNQQGMGTIIPIMEYTTSYSGGMQKNASCAGDRCEYEVNGPFQACDTAASSISNITVSATNVFGQGQASMPLTFGCTNQFLHVNYTSSAIVCTFLNAMDTGVKSCTVMYGSCDQKVDKRLASGNSTVDRPNYIEIQLGTSTANVDCVMYIVTASSDTYTVIVEATRNMQSGTTSRVVIVVIATVVPIGILVVAIIIIVTIVIIVALCTRTKEINVERKRSTSVSKSPQPREHWDIIQDKTNPQPESLWSKLKFWKSKSS